jgi:5-methylcytosine-specific restriction endonuclease McrA
MPRGYLAKNWKNIKGQKFNKLKVVEYCGPNSHGKAQWYCECDCGKSIVVIGISLRNGHTKSCGCLSRYESGIAALNWLYYSYQKGAKSRGLEWNLTKEQFQALTSSCCSICGIFPKQSAIVSSEEWKYNGNYLYNGIDRIDNTVGYVFDNCRTACKICNGAKHSMTETNFQQWLDRIIEFRLNKIS